MNFKENGIIELERELSELDQFVLDFVKVLEKHASYVIVSGYVAILFGRTRTTEDVDMFIEILDLEKAKLLYEDLLRSGFWALNVNSEVDFFSALSENIAVRFARNGVVIPNMEVKFVKDYLDKITLENKVKVFTRGGIICISELALQIAYKRFVLKSEKDIEDAQHLQEWFNISDENVNKYRHILKEHGRI
ncbi:hypothetical protein HYU21_04295 [Candidatus Woesearchaeota archaeon]|nr:hypothetical protein [Candidatus Woesearchaeota archaeon]